MFTVVLAHLVGDRPAFLIASVTDPSAGDPLTILIGYGPLGIMFVLLATHQFSTKWEVQRLEAQIQRLEKQVEGLVADNRAKDELIRAFQMQLTGHALPALAQSARVFEAIPNTDNADALGETKRLLDELAKQVSSLKQREQP